VEALHAVAVDSLDSIYSLLVNDGVPTAEITLGSHEPIAVAVRDGDAAAAARAMRRHFELSLPDIDYGLFSLLSETAPAPALSGTRPSRERTA
jgi:DNA-binding GntR family transcriptional regulator